MPAHVVLKTKRALPFFSRHPWVFAGAIANIKGNPQPGDEVVLLSSKSEFIARGLYNPHSQIRVRLYSWDENVSLDGDFWRTRIRAAVALRRTLGLLGERSACRLIFSEGDGLSGLTVDYYGGWLSVQLSSRALAERADLLLDLLVEEVAPRGIWLRTEKGIQDLEGLELADGLLRGEKPPSPLYIEDGGICYLVDIVQGQKTGFYLDQRANRLATAGYVRDHRVLDTFCYTGGFALSCLKLGGAREVFAVDASAAALEAAEENARLNEVSDRLQLHKADVFDALEQLRDQGEQFDTVILDPPKLARQRRGIKQALRGYHGLNRLAVDVLKPGGILVTCSCSGMVTGEQFEQMLANVALQADRPLQILESRSQAADHPVSIHCAESRYLKCSICRVL